MSVNRSWEDRDEAEPAKSAESQLAKLLFNQKTVTEFKYSCCFKIIILNSLTARVSFHYFQTAQIICLWWATGIHDTSFINPCIKSSCASENLQNSRSCGMFLECSGQYLPKEVQRNTFSRVMTHWCVYREKGRSFRKATVAQTADNSLAMIRRCQNTQYTAVCCRW